MRSIPGNIFEYRFFLLLRTSFAEMYSVSSATGDMFFSILIE